MAEAWSRREVLWTPLVVGALACETRRASRATPSASAGSPLGGASESGTGVAAAWGGLEVARVGALREDERGGALVVLLHGYGAGGDDLVSLARALARPGVRFLIPAAPLPQGGGRKWWSLDPGDRPSHTWTDELPPGYQEHAQVRAAREAIQALLRQAREAYAPERVSLVGFSQGAMLALHVAVSGEPPVDRVAALSGVLIADSLVPLHQPKAARPAVFVSHGRQDPVVPFGGGEAIATILKPHGYQVTLLPFDGGHAIPPLVVEAVREFLFAAP